MISFRLGSLFALFTICDTYRASDPIRCLCSRHLRGLLSAADPREQGDPRVFPPKYVFGIFVKILVVVIAVRIYFWVSSAVHRSLCLPLATAMLALLRWLCVEPESGYQEASALLLLRVALATWTLVRFHVTLKILKNFCEKRQWTSWRSYRRHRSFLEQHSLKRLLIPSAWDVSGSSMVFFKSFLSLVRKVVPFALWLWFKLL